MIEQFTLARPYAKAAFEFAEIHRDVQKWADFMQVATALAKNQSIIQVLNNPEISEEKKIELFIELCHDYLNPERKNFLRLLGNYKRLRILPAITELFLERVTASKNHLNIILKSAFAMSEPQLENIKQTLQKYLKHDISMKVEVDPSLIGGMLIKAGDLVIDSSLCNQLNQLKQSLLAE